MDRPAVACDCVRFGIQTPLLPISHFTSNGNQKSFEAVHGPSRFPTLMSGRIDKRDEPGRNRQMKDKIVTGYLKIKKGDFLVQILDASTPWGFTIFSEYHAWEGLAI